MCGESALTFQTSGKVIELSVCHRQSTDVKFANILDHVASGQFNYVDYETLSHRRLNILSKLEQDKFSKAIHIFATNDAINKKNEKCLRKLNKPVLNIRAIDVSSCVGNIDDDTGLQAELFIAIGC